MSLRVDCVVLGCESDALDAAPWPGELGQRILANVQKLDGNSGCSDRPCC